jgi:uncharacterized RDD family membrane protein YckC
MRADEVGPTNNLRDLAEAVRQSRTEGRRARPIQRASGGMRLGAAVLDLIAFAFASAVLLVTVGAILAPLPVMRMTVSGPAVLWSAVTLSTITDIVPGRSPGKFIMGLKITRSNGTPSSRGRLAGRWAVKYGWLMLLALSDVLGEWAVTNRRSGAASPTRVAIYHYSQFANAAGWYLAIPACAGLMGAFLPARRTLHDWLADTAIYSDADVLNDPQSLERAFEVTPLCDDSQHSG